MMTTDVAGPGGDRPGVLDVLVAVTAVTFATLSLVAMVVVVATGDQTLAVAVIEVATWAATTFAVAWVMWRQTIWGRRRT